MTGRRREFSWILDCGGREPTMWLTPCCLVEVGTIVDAGGVFFT